jgi:TRAP-type mannitol/chloroaromatic compound transport system permease small subunit
MRFLKRFIRAIDAINVWVGRFLAYFLFAFFVLLFIEVILRYFFNSPTVWANELAQMLFGAYAILGGGYILLTGGHVNVDIVYTRFPAKTRAAVDIVTSVLFFLFCGMLPGLGFPFAVRAFPIRLESAAVSRQADDTDSGCAAHPSGYRQAHPGCPDTAWQRRLSRSEA